MRRREDMTVSGEDTSAGLGFQDEGAPVLGVEKRNLRAEHLPGLL